MLKRKTPAAMLRAASVTIFTLFLLTQLGGCKNDEDSSKVSGSKSGILSYVPADTIFFLGGLEAISIKETTQLFGENTGMFFEAFKDDLKKSSNPNSPPAEKMLKQLLLDYFKAMEKPDQFAKTLGIDDNMRFAIYSVGTMPVLRMHLNDKAAFETFVQNSENQAGVKGKVENLGSAKIRSYAFDQTPDAKSLGSAFVIGTQGDYVVVSAKVDKLSDEVNRQIVGDILPKTPLNKDVLSSLVSSYQFDPRYLFYIDHKQIMRGLTHSDNQFGSMLNDFIQMAEKNKMDAMADAEKKDDNAMGEDKTKEMSPTKAAENENPFAKIQTPECQKELTAKVETWPRTVGGYTTLDFKSKPAKFDFKAVIEIHDTKFVQSLASLRGVIPQYISDRNKPMIFGLGVGVNIDAVAPFVTQFIQEFTAQNYQCEFLAEMKQKMQASNPAMGIAMMTGMAAGVYGVSASLLSFEGDFDPSMKMPPDIKNLQAIITVSAKNPQMLLMMLSKMQPGMPPIQLPGDGKAIDFPMPIPAPEPIKLAQKGQHIVAYIGKDAALLADEVAKQTLQGNGLLLANLDYQKYLKLLMDSASKSMANPGDQDPEIQKMKKIFENLKYRIVEGMDISDKGIEFTADMTLN